MYAGLKAHLEILSSDRMHIRATLFHYQGVQLYPICHTGCFLRSEDPFLFCTDNSQTIITLLVLKLHLHNKINECVAILSSVELGLQERLFTFILCRHT